MRHLSWILSSMLVLGSPVGVIGQTVFFEENFDDNSSGWALETEWEIGPASASGGQSSACGSADPASDGDGVTGGGIAGIVIGGNASTVVHPYYYITSPPFDATGSAIVTLEFDRWLNSDYTPYMQNSVEVFDGAVWQVVWQSGAAPSVTDDSWSHHSFDVTPHANVMFQVRFGMQVGSSGAYTCSSWNLDNVKVMAPDASPSGFTRGDVDANGVFNALVDALYLLTFGFLNGPPPVCLEATDADGDAAQNALVDSLYILTHGFMGGPAPTLPYPACGNDPDSASSLGCLLGPCP